MGMQARSKGPRRAPISRKAGQTGREAAGEVVEGSIGEERGKCQ